MPDTRTAAAEPFRQRQAKRADTLPMPYFARVLRGLALNKFQAEARLISMAAIDNGII